MRRKAYHRFAAAAAGIFICISLVSLGWSSEAAVTTKDLNIFRWRHIGPWNFSGRITDFAVSPGQSKIYYVATATGGLWKTKDHGISFRPIFEKYGNMSMGDVEVAPSDPNILYLGTGEALHARSSAHGNGMWKSTDGGKSWKHIGLEESYFIPRIAIHPENPDIVYVAAEGKLYDNEMDCQRGLYKTTDGGETWLQMLDLKDRGVGDFVMDPRNPDVLIASAYKTYRRTWTFIDRQKGNYLYKSTDGGKTWKQLTEGLPLDIESGWNGLAIYPKNPDIVYVRIDEEVNLGLEESENAYLLRPGRVFRDGYYFARFASYRIPKRLLEVVDFEPLKAENEKDLAELFNKLIKDRKFLSGLNVDLEILMEKAEKIYRDNEKILKLIEEMKRTMKRDEEQRQWEEKINRLVLLTLFTGSKGIRVEEYRLIVEDVSLVELNEAFEKTVKFSDEGIKSAAELAQNAENWISEREFLEKLGLNFNTFAREARELFKDDEDKKAAVKDLDNKAEEIQKSRGRYQTINRFVLQILYAGALAEMEPVTKSGVIYRSEDLGETWKRMTEYKLTGGSVEVNQIEAGYSGRILVDPNNDKILYAVEVRVKKSADGGKTFKNAPWTGAHKCHVDTRGMWIDPDDSNHILNGNDGGVSETWDGGSHWSQKDTISAQQFYEISVDNQMPYNVMGGTQDNGSWIGPSRNRNPNGVFPADWKYLPSGDGFYVERDWWNPEYIYFESQFGYSRRMNLNSGEMISLSRRNTDEERESGKPAQRYQWDSPIVLSPHNPGVVFICSQFVHRSMSRGEPKTWEAISPDLTRANKERIAQSKLTNLKYPTVYTFAESPVKPGLYWAGTDDGNLQLSVDRGKSWTNLTFQHWTRKGKPKKDISGARIPFDRWVTKVEPSAHDEKTCYVTYSGYRTHNEDRSYIFVTRDLGKTWEDLSQGMNNPVRDIEEDPDNGNVLYLATDYGLFVSMDKGKSWTEMSSSAPDVIIMDVDIQKRDRDLVIGTYGRGIYIVDIFPFKEFNREVFEKDSHLFAVQPVVKWNMWDRRGSVYGEFARAVNPPVQARFTYYLQETAKEVKMVIRDCSGEDIYELQGKLTAGLHRSGWALRKKASEDGENMGQGGRMAEAGEYTVILMINGEEAASQKFRIMDDPMMK